MIFNSLFLCVLFFAGKKFLKLKLLDGRFDVFSVVIIVYGFGSGIILMFV